MNFFPKNVHFLSTERYLKGGQSVKNFSNFNLALHVNDQAEHVIQNRLLLKETNINESIYFRFQRVLIIITLRATTRSHKQQRAVLDFHKNQTTKFSKSQCL